MHIRFSKYYYFERIQLSSACDSIISILRYPSNIYIIVKKIAIANNPEELIRGDEILTLSKSEVLERTNTKVSRMYISRRYVFSCYVIIHSRDSNVI